MTKARWKQGLYIIYYFRNVSYFCISEMNNHKEHEKCWRNNAEYLNFVSSYVEWTCCTSIKRFRQSLGFASTLTQWVKLSNNTHRGDRYCYKQVKTFLLNDKRQTRNKTYTHTHTHTHTHTKKKTKKTHKTSWGLVHLQ